MTHPYRLIQIDHHEPAPRGCFDPNELSPEEAHARLARDMIRHKEGRRLGVLHCDLFEEATAHDALHDLAAGKDLSPVQHACVHQLIDEAHAENAAL